ncbi:MAG: hypothetical protein ABR505_05865 [Actinomycetota bacterium]
MQSEPKGAAIHSQQLHRKRLGAWLFVALLLGGCGGDTQEPAAGSSPEAPQPSPAPEPTPLGKPDVVLKVKTPSGRRFVPEELRASAGDVVKIVYTNLSDFPHQFKIYADTSPHAALLGATRTTDEPKPRSIIFRLPEQPGRYFYFCPILGHGLVMRGFLIAK